jgi:hypothetical protein
MVPPLWLKNSGARRWRRGCPFALGEYSTSQWQLKKIYTELPAFLEDVGGRFWPGAGATPVSRGGGFLG